MLNDILCPEQIQWQPSTDQTLYQSVTFLLTSTFYQQEICFSVSIDTTSDRNN